MTYQSRISLRGFGRINVEVMMVQDERRPWTGLYVVVFYYVYAAVVHEGLPLCFRLVFGLKYVERLPVPTLINELCYRNDLKTFIIK